MARARNTLSTKGFHLGPTRVAPPRARGPGPEGRRQTRSWLGWQRGRGARGGTRPGREKKRSISVALALHCKRNPQAGWEVPLDPPRSPDPPVAAWAWGGEVAPPAPGPWHWQPGGGEIRGSGSFLFPRLPGGYITRRSQGSKQRTGPLPDEPIRVPYLTPGGPLLLSLASCSLLAHRP